MLRQLTIKNFAIGVITEASELLEHFRFKNEKEIAEMLKNKAKKEEIEDELADLPPNPFIGGVLDPPERPKGVEWVLRGCLLPRTYKASGTVW
jgi:hypothetical protein